MQAIRKYQPSKEDVIRIEMIEAPTERLPDEGQYEWKHRGDKLYMDLLTLEKEIEKVMPGKSERILDRLQNFRKCFLNLTTGEIIT